MIIFWMMRGKTIEIKKTMRKVKLDLCSGSISILRFEV